MEPCRSRLRGRLWSRPARLAGIAAALAVWAAGPAEPLPAPRPTDHEVKAAFLYNFAKFVKWPDELPAGSPFVVAVLGEDTFEGVLAGTLRGKTVLDRAVEVRRVDALADARRVRILFVAASEKRRLPDVVAALDGASVLTVGDMDGFADQGGMIAFKQKQDTVAFEVNLDQADQAGLKVSSQLLRLAQRVISRRAAALP
jgi:hypothetical protein